MALATTGNRVSYSGNGVTVAFSFPNYFLVDANLVVLLVDNTTKAETAQVLTTNYTIAGAGVSAGGTVTFLVAPASGKTVVIYRSPSPTQAYDPLENGPLPVTALGQSLDKIMMVVQRCLDLVTRAVHLPEGFTGSFDMTLPKTIAANPGATIVVNATGDGFDIGPTGADIASAQANAAAAAASASAASSSASTASASATSAAASALAVVYNKITIPYTSFQTASTTNTIVAFSLPANAIIDSLIVKHTTAFSGGIISALTLGIGILGDTGKFIDAFDVFQAVADSAFESMAPRYLASFASSTSIKITATSTGANLSALTAGSVDVYYRTPSIV